MIHSCERSGSCQMCRLLVLSSTFRGVNEGLQSFLELLLRIFDDSGRRTRQPLWITPRVGAIWKHCAEAWLSHGLLESLEDFLEGTHETIEWIPDHESMLHLSPGRNPAHVRYDTEAVPSA
eukprot:scaffold3772_cov390-Prasinococcus_capsulatus_cf.AAC.8